MIDLFGLISSILHVKNVQASCNERVSGRAATNLHFSKQQQNIPFFFFQKSRINEKKKEKVTWDNYNETPEMIHPNYNEIMCHLLEAK